MLFRRAEMAFRANDFAAARRDAMAVLQVIGEHGGVLHLLALIEAGAGALPSAQAAFVRALRQAPRDPQIHNNFGNLLARVGANEKALHHYGEALAADPGFHAARTNRAGVLLELGMIDGAMVDLDAVLAHSPRTLEARLTRAGAHLRAGRFEAAASDYDAALRESPQHPTALLGRARAAMEAGDEAKALGFYQRALVVRPGDAEVILGLAEAMEAVGDSGGQALVAVQVARQPEWIAGHDSLARMRSEAGDTAAIDASYRAAIATRPRDRALALAHVACLARAGRQGEALSALDAALPAIGGGPDTLLYEAVLASEAGDLQRADAAFAKLDTRDDVQMARGRHALRSRDPAAAAAVLEPVARRDLGAVTVWAHLGIAWRLLDDPRSAWLDGQPGMFGPQDLDIDACEIALLAASLRALHRSRTHPIGQSLRGGTQTRGRLFGRPDAAITQLEVRLRAAVAAHMAQLPPYDPLHPLLRHRTAPPRFAGSWSVRLSDGGFHVNHVHPAGVLSSAFYVVVPEVAGAGGEAGWLEIGAPPVELGLELPPLLRVEPRPGRLVLFPSTMFHGTRPFAAGERLTVAFDVIA